MVVLSCIFLYFLSGAVAIRSGILRSTARNGNLILSATTSSIKADVIRVALTRELGENSKLQNLLLGVECAEIPCIQFALTEEAMQLKSEIEDCKHDLISLTSPQAAQVFIDAWKSVGKPDVKIAAVGRGTSKVLLAEGLKPVFEPTEALGEIFASELPLNLGQRVLHPCSALADDKIQRILEQRGFQCTRLSTYTTIPATWSTEDLERACTVDIVTFASPSTVRVWCDRMSSSGKTFLNVPAVVIGPSSQKAAIAAGFQHVVSPVEGSKGLESWARSVLDVAQQLREQRL